jgi:hypothetical protein
MTMAGIPEGPPTGPTFRGCWTIAILDADGGHLHYLIQVNPDFSLLAGCELRNHRGILH